MGDKKGLDSGEEKKPLTLGTNAAEVDDSGIKALKNGKYVEHAPLGRVERTLELKYGVPDEKRLAWARPIAAKIENDLPKNKEEVYAREALILHERQKTSLKLQAIRIGDLSIATLPNEVYAITGLKLRAASPLGTHFNIELANGAEGYIPPYEQHALGGYTTWPARTAVLEQRAEMEITGQPKLAFRELAGSFNDISKHVNGDYVQLTHVYKLSAYFLCEDFGLVFETEVLTNSATIA